MTVTRLETEMGAAEYLGWIAFYSERNRKQEAERGNLMAMDEDEIVARLTSGG